MWKDALIIPISVCYHWELRCATTTLTSKSHLRSTMSKQPSELLLVEIKLLSKMLLH